MKFCFWAFVAILAFTSSSFAVRPPFLPPSRSAIVNPYQGPVSVRSVEDHGPGFAQLLSAELRGTLGLTNAEVRFLGPIPVDVHAFSSQLHSIDGSERRFLPLGTINRGQRSEMRGMILALPMTPSMWDRMNNLRTFAIFSALRLENFPHPALAAHGYAHVTHAEDVEQALARREVRPAGPYMAGDVLSRHEVYDQVLHHI